MKAIYITSAAKAEQLPQENLPEIAFIGRSNCGKSSLLNALVGSRNLARTSRTPGRTQMANFFEINEKLNLVDLPGYGFAKTPVKIAENWQALLEKYLTRQSIKQFLFLADCRRKLDDADQWILEQIAKRTDPIIVLTKTDKINRSQQAATIKEWKNVIEKIGVEAQSVYGVL